MLLLAFCSCNTEGKTATWASFSDLQSYLPTSKLTVWASFSKLIVVIHGNPELLPTVVPRSGSEVIILSLVYKLLRGLVETMIFVCEK